MTDTVRGTKPRDYGAEILGERPNSSDPVYEIPGPRVMSPSSMLVRVHPNGGQRWIGVFYDTAPVMTHRRGLFATSREDEIAVMLGSSVWWVNVFDPCERAAIDLDHAEDAIFDPDRDQVIVSNCTAVSAFGQEGLRWKIAGQELDCLRLSEPNGDMMTSVGYSIFGNGSMSVTFDLRTGSPLAGPVERVFGSAR